MFMSIYQDRGLKGTVGCSVPPLPVWGSAAESSPNISFPDRHPISLEKHGFVSASKEASLHAFSRHASLLESARMDFTYGFRCSRQQEGADGRLKVFQCMQSAADGREKKLGI